MNVKKRSKKHLRLDFLKNQERKEEEEEEKERLLLLQQQQLLNNQNESDDSDDDIIEEYLVYICECCRKKFNTTNAFQNHSNSIKHRENAQFYEEAGLIVTGLQFVGDEDDEADDDEADAGHDDEEVQEDDDDYDQDDQEEYQWGDSDDDEVIDGEEEETDEEEEEEEEEKPRVKNVFAAFADDSSSSDSSEDEEEDDDEQDRKLPAVSLTPDDDEDEEDDIDMLEEIIYQNQLLQSEIDATEIPAVATVAPLPFDDTTYDPDDYTVDENRLASVRHRLQKRLAAKGIESTRQDDNFEAASDAVSIGKTLLQQVMEANIGTLQAKLEAYNKHKKECQILNRQFALAKGNSKALPGQYVYRPDAADDTRKRANIHHTGSHYHMAASRSMNFGRQKGLLARHSSQGARLQATRMAAKETARMQTGGGAMKAGKKSKKSQQKKQGEAGGSKKSGGTGDK